MKNPLVGKKILIGISGGIAVYKVCSLINYLKKAQAVVRVVMTDSAAKFVGPLTFESLTNSHVYSDLFNSFEKAKIEHIALADWCDAMVIVPATYNTIGKVASGIADNMLTTIVAALPAPVPVLFAPAMNCHMWENQINVDNIKKLKAIKISPRKFKYSFIGPTKGQLVCGYEGDGVLIDSATIVKAVEALF